MSYQLTPCLGTLCLAALGGSGAVMPEEQLQERELIRTGASNAIDSGVSSSSKSAKGGSGSGKGGSVAMTRRDGSLDGRPAAAAPPPTDTDAPTPPPKPAPAADESDEDKFKVWSSKDAACSHAGCNSA